MKKEKSDLEKEIETLKDNIEFLHSCLDDRDKSIAIMQEENKKLKEYNGELIENHKKDIAILCEENKKLQENIKWYEKEEDRLREENNRLKNNAMEDMRVQTKLEDRIKELEQCNINLQTWLDNKEKVNKSLREELSAYDREYFDEDKKAKNIFIDKSGKVIKGGEFTTLC